MSVVEDLLSAFIVGIVLLAAGYLWGYHASSNAQSKKQLVQQNAAIVVKEHKEDAGRQVTQAYQVKSADRAKTFRAIEKRGEANEQKNAAAYVECGLDDDGLRVWRDANAGAESEAGSGADDGAGSAAATGLGKAEGSGQQPHGSGEAVSPTGGPLPRPGGLDQ